MISNITFALRPGLSILVATLLACGGVVDPAGPASDDGLNSGDAGGSASGIGGEGGGHSDSGGQALGGSGGSGNPAQGGSDPDTCPVSENANYGFSIATTVVEERFTGWCVVAIEATGESGLAYQLTCDNPDGGTHEITLSVSAVGIAGNAIAVSLFNGQDVYVDLEHSMPWWEERWLTISGYGDNMLVQAIIASNLTSPSGLSPLGFAQPVAGLCELENLDCGMSQRIGADVENPLYGGTLRIFDGQHTADTGSRLEYFVDTASLRDPDEITCDDVPTSWWQVIGGFGVNKCDTTLTGCGEAETCDPDTWLLFPTTCLATNCDAPIGYCDQPVEE